MKKILILSLLTVSLLATGCTNSNNLQSSNKESIEVEVLNVDEYVKRFGELFKNTTSFNTSIAYSYYNPDRLDVYAEKYKNYEIEKQNNLADRERHKDFIDNAIKFKSDDDTINKFHNKMIKNSMLIHTVLEEADYMYEKYKKCSKALEEGVAGECKHDVHNPQKYEDIYNGLKTYAEAHMLDAITPLLTDYTDYLKEIGYKYNESSEK